MKVRDLIDELLQFDGDAELHAFEGTRLQPTSYAPEMVGIDEKDKECPPAYSKKTAVILSRSS